jgi:hypothetical protein
MRLDLTTSFADVILELAARRIEGIADRHVHVLMGVMGLAFAAADIAF